MLDYDRSVECIGMRVKFDFRLIKKVAPSYTIFRFEISFNIRRVWKSSRRFVIYLDKMYCSGF